MLPFPMRFTGNEESKSQTNVSFHSKTKRLKQTTLLDLLTTDY